MSRSNQETGGTESAGGLNVRSAASAIEGMLQADGDDYNAPGHVDGKKRKLKRDILSPKDSYDEDVDIDDEDDADYEESDDSDAPQPRNTRDDDDIDDGDDVERDDDGEETEEIATLSDLAEELELDPEELLSNLSHSFKASGEQMTVTLAELVKGYQKDADYRKNTTSLKQERAAFEAEARKRNEAFHAQATVHAQQLQALEQGIVGELNTPEMAELKSYDPGKWAAKTQEINMRLEQLRQQRTQAAQAYEQHFNSERNAFMAREAETLRKEVPDWGRKKLETAVNVIRDLGFSDSELANVADSRFIKAALRLHELEQFKKTAEARIAKAGKTAKKVKRDVPKTVKPGKRQSGRARVQRGKLANAKSRLRKSAKAGGRSNLQDAARVIEQFL